MQKIHNNGATTNSTIRVLDPAPAAPSSPPPSTTTANGGGVPACASCRHQRKKCTQKCMLAPFFPAEKAQDFQTVHKVFGISNVTKLLIWEANCRLHDPVLGALGEFQRVCEELRFYKSRYQMANLCQVPITQGAVLFNNKPAQQRLIGPWVNGDRIAVNNGSMLDYIASNGMAGGIDDSRMFNFVSLQNLEKIKHGRDQQGSLIHPQQQITNDFSQF
ncbi:hypothetical protein R6Q57_015351 [Mikania cordata]